MSKMMNTLLVALLTGMALSASGLARAEIAEKATEAKDATVQAAQKTGEAVSEATSATVAASKSFAHKTADTAVWVYYKTKQVTKEAIGTAAEKTREAAGKVEGAVSK
jgi:cytoskeletal protein RodZ